MFGVENSSRDNIFNEKKTSLKHPTLKKLWRVHFHKNMASQEVMKVGCHGLPRQARRTAPKSW